MDIKENQLGGTFEEYISRGNYIFHPKVSLRLGVDMIEYGIKHIPKMDFHIAHPYELREGGCTLIQEVAFGLACGIAYIEAGLKRGLNVDDFAHRVSFGCSTHMNFLRK